MPAVEAADTFQCFLHMQQGKRGSNPHLRFWRPPLYHWTIPLSVNILSWLTTSIVYHALQYLSIFFCRFSCLIFMIFMCWFLCLIFITIISWQTHERKYGSPIHDVNHLLFPKKQRTKLKQLNSGRCPQIQMSRNRKMNHNQIRLPFSSAVLTWLSFSPAIHTC